MGSGFQVQASQETESGNYPFLKACTQTQIQPGSPTLFVSQALTGDSRPGDRDSTSWWEEHQKLVLKLPCACQAFFSSCGFLHYIFLSFIGLCCVGNRVLIFLSISHLPGQVCHQSDLLPPHALILSGYAFHPRCSARPLLGSCEALCTVCSFKAMLENTFRG